MRRAVGLVMSHRFRMPSVLAGALLLALACRGGREEHLERRDEVSFLRGPYNTAWYERHRRTYRIGAAIHFAHGRQHDVLLRTPMSEHARVDAETEAEYLRFVRELTARTEPTQEMYAPFTARTMWKVFRVIDWTHAHHEQTYDILSERRIAWDEKSRWLARSIRHYLEANDVGFSPAPLDVTMRRAAVMGKPYFTLFRNRYPRSNDFFYAAHWWHPAVYEAHLIGGPDGQERIVREVDHLYLAQVLRERPRRMLLSREMMPRYARLDPESANVFDNLHMFHGIVYDVLSYEGWSAEEKRDELYRVIDAMLRHPGDEAMTRKFPLPRPGIDPTTYEEWMRSVDGEMTRIMREMHDEMMPLMMAEGGAQDSHAMHEALRKKLAPGLEEGEHPGSLHDALMAVMPGMKSDPENLRPGGTPRRMVEAMLRGWRERHGEMPDVPPLILERTDGPGGARR